MAVGLRDYVFCHKFSIMRHIIRRQNMKSGWSLGVTRVKETLNNKLFPQWTTLSPSMPHQYTTNISVASHIYASTQVQT
jgi:hypothetical protein